MEIWKEGMIRWFNMFVNNVFIIYKVNEIIREVYEVWGWVCKFCKV